MDTQKDSLEDEEGAAELARRVRAATTIAEQAALLVWLHQLIVVRDSDASDFTKAIAALTLTAKSDAVWPVVKVLAGELKHYGWDERGTASRYGLAAASVGLVAFGWAGGAGIAAFGGAIGVPLWIVLGAGGLAAGALVEEFSPAKGEKS